MNNRRGGFWKQPVAPHAEAAYAALKAEMTGPWEVMPGRSHRDGWANGRVNVALADQAGLMSRSTIMCYEVIEFEPTPPAAVLQFEHIRRVLKEEGRFAGAARGVFGNAQQPVMVLPNLYYFARGAADPGYLDKAERDVLTDLAHELGGDPAVLVPAWSCLKLSLAELSADLASRVRALKLTTEFANSLPGGPARYVEILAAQVAARRGLLEAVAGKPQNAVEAARSLAQSATALLNWWQTHRYVGMGRAGSPFRWDFVHGSQVAILRAHAKTCVAFGAEVPALAAGQLANAGLLPADQAADRIKDLLR